MNKEKIVKIYLADDHQIIIDGLTLLLNNNPQYIVIGSGTNGNKAHADIVLLQPEIAILDIKMPGKTGIEVLKLIENQVNTKVIFLTMHVEKSIIFEARNHGAYAFLPKNTPKAELFKVIDSVLTGKRFFPDTTPSAEGIFIKFSPREKDIIKLVVVGLSTIEIADQLGLSRFTVDTHRKNINLKTGTKTPFNLIKYIEDNDLTF